MTKTFSSLVLAAVSLLWLASCDAIGGGVTIAAGDDQSGKSYDSVSGSMKVGSGARAGDLSSVNGSIRIASQAQVGELSTVNGSIRMAADSSADSAETVNGSISLQEGVQIAGSISAVNGSLELAENVEVDGSITNVNGRIALQGADVQADVEGVNGSISLAAAKVGGNLTTTNGSIELSDGAVIEGDLTVRKTRKLFSSGKDRGRGKPKIIIGENCRVDGKLMFEREVELWVHDRAEVGEIEGATAQRFSGSSPS